MISHPFRCIFVHIPKTAGNSVNRVFGVDWQDHKDLARYAIEQPPEIFQSYFKFAIVRNPWDRLFSDYNYQRKKSRAKDSKLFLFNENGRQRNFAAWIDTALAHATQYAPQQWGGDVSPTIHRWSPQLDWITVAGKPSVDFVAHMENLSEDFPVICRQVGLPPVHLPHRNRRLHWHYSHYYDRHTRDVVAAYYAQDIAAFGYDFEDRTFRTHVFLSAAGLFTADRKPDVPKTQENSDRPPLARSEPETHLTVAGYRRPPAGRSRLSTALAVGVMLVGSWMSFGFLNSPGVTSADPAEPPRAQRFTEVLFPLAPRVIRPTLAGSALSLFTKIHLVAALIPPTTPLLGLASAFDVSIPPDRIAPRPGRSYARFGSPAPVFANHRSDSNWLQRLRRTP